MCRFLPLIFLPASKPDGSTREPLFRALHTLAVDDRGGRARVFTRLFANLDEQGMVQPAERPVPGPKREIAVHRAPRRQVLGQGTPLATRGQHVEDAVQHLAHVHGAPAAAAPGRRDKGSTSAHSPSLRSLG